MVRVVRARRLFAALLLLGSLAGCAHRGDVSVQHASSGSAAVAIRAAVAASDRPAADRARDVDRRPAEVLSFFGIHPDMVVADLMAGRGYYTEILARLVGPAGKVYCQNNAFVVNRFADGPLKERLARPGLERVERWDRELDDLGFTPGSLDAALMVLFYHDTYWQGVDRPRMLAEIVSALKPGGVFGVVDHHAAPGHGADDVKTLHRVEASLVRSEIEAAGFELVAESNLLSHPEDARTLNVFDPAIRGKTDRFIFLFRKP